jgi:hypothetical protein
MDAHGKWAGGCLSVLVGLAAMVPAARANLLVDPGFETNPTTSAFNVLTNFPGYQGQWGPEVGAITGATGGVTPAQGVKMLSMSDDGLTATQTFQTTNVSALSGMINSGTATINLKALFNAGPNVPAAVGAVYVQFFSGPSYGTQIGTGAGSGLTLDGNPQTWQPIALSATVPVGTTWVMSQVFFVNSSLLSNPGYVDAADMTITPEPVSMALLGLGGAVLLRRRRAA